MRLISKIQRDSLGSKYIFPPAHFYRVFSYTAASYPLLHVLDEFSRRIQGNSSLTTGVAIANNLFIACIIALLQRPLHSYGSVFFYAQQRETVL